MVLRETRPPAGGSRKGVLVLNAHDTNIVSLMYLNESIDS